MPMRREASPSKSDELMSAGSGAGAASVYLPGWGARSASGSDPLVSSILMSLEAALTFVRRFERPFIDRPSYSSFSSPALTTIR